MKRVYAGKTAVVTGAGSGIGRALALTLADRGARLALSDIDDAALAATVDACRSTGADAQGWRLDVSDRDAVYAHADDVVQRFDEVHLVVNNAGVAVHGRVSEIGEADMVWIMNINYWGVVYGSRAFLPHLIASGDGQLANVSSVFGLIASAKDAAYNASKFAVRGFTEALRQEVRIDGQPVAVSCVHPGGIKTNIARSARMGASEDAAAVGALFDRVAVTTPSRAARAIMSGLERDRARILVGPDAYLIAALPRLLGPHYHHLIERSFKLLNA